MNRKVGTWRLRGTAPTMTIRAPQSPQEPRGRPSDWRCARTGAGLRIGSSSKQSAQRPAEPGRVSC
ncbi:hypothetical protein [Streptomyces acidicola]|uniref:hypothetical protein n=1 Tax=Streptomyces acidicola TaxID=2596892 RepID=UPI001883DE92|nr:hypothetical protein [Streptomyces acidicola]